MPAQRRKPIASANGQSAPILSPEIAEAIFEVAHYDEKLAEKIWEEGSDEYSSKPPLKKQTKIRSFGVNRLSNVKTSSAKTPPRTRGVFFD